MIGSVEHARNVLRRTRSATNWHSYSLLVESKGPYRLRRTAAILSPVLRTAELRTATMGRIKTGSGKSISGLRLQGFNCLLRISNEPAPMSSAAIRALVGSRHFGAIPNGVSLHSGTSSSRILEWLTGEPSEGETLANRFSSLLDGDARARGLPVAAIHDLFLLNQRGAISFLSSIFDPAESDAQRSPAFVFSHEHFQSGGAANWLDQVSGLAQKSAEGQSGFEEGIDYLAKKAVELFEWVIGGGDEADEDTEADEDSSSEPPKDAGLPGGVPENPDDGAKFTPHDEWDTPVSGSSVEVTRLIGGGYSDPLPDGVGTEVSMIVGNLAFRGGYTDPSPEENDNGPTPDASGIAGLLVRGGFTDPSPLLLKLRMGRVTFRMD